MSHEKITYLVTAVVFVIVMWLVWKQHPDEAQSDEAVVKRSAHFSSVDFLS